MRNLHNALQILNFKGGFCHIWGLCSVMPIPQPSVMFSDIGTIIFMLVKKSWGKGKLHVITLVWCMSVSVCKRRNLLVENKGLSWFMILSIMSFRNIMVLITWLIFTMFWLIKPLEVLAMEMTLFKTFDWLIWLLYSCLMSCFIDLMSLSFAVLNKEWNNLPKGNKDVLILMSLGLWTLPVRLSIWISVKVISHKTKLMSSIVIFKSREYLGSSLWNDSEYLVKDCCTLRAYWLMPNKASL